MEHFLPGTVLGNKNTEMSKIQFFQKIKYSSFFQGAYNLIDKTRAQITRTRGRVCNEKLKQISVAVEEIESLHLVEKVRRGCEDLVPFEPETRNVNGLTKNVSLGRYKSLK